MCMLAVRLWTTQTYDMHSNAFHTKRSIGYWLFTKYEYVLVFFKKLFVHWFQTHISIWTNKIDCIHSEWMGKIRRKKSNHNKSDQVRSGSVSIRTTSHKFNWLANIKEKLSAFIIFFILLVNSIAAMFVCKSNVANLYNNNNIYKMIYWKIIFSFEISE